MKTQDVYKLMFRDYPDVVTVEQMCEMLGGISTKTGYWLPKDGTIKSFVVGRRYRILKLYIFEYLEIMDSKSARLPTYH